jgi:hypothetical protein
MRKLGIILSVIGLLSLTGCIQETDVKAMLQDSETRSEIIKAITENHDFMMELMDNVQGNDHAMQMMQGNKKMMGNMMKGQGMQMMMKDSMMMKNMMQEMMGNMHGRQSMMNGMMKDGKMMGNMMKMMRKKGMMSEDCMQSCMKMMGDKGMDMMNNNDEDFQPNEEDHSSHH